MAYAINYFELLEIVSGDKASKEYTFNSNDYNRWDSLTHLVPKYKTKLSNSLKKLKTKTSNQDDQDLDRFLDSIEKKSLAFLDAVNKYNDIENGNFQIDKDALLKEMHAFIELLKKKINSFNIISKNKIGQKA